MKKIVHVVTLSLAAVSLLLLTGCQSVSTSHTQDIGAPRLAASDPTRVEILRTEPTRAHVRIGQVRAEPSEMNVDVSKIEGALRKEAAKLGADAAVVVYDKTQVTGQMVVGTWRFQTVENVEGRVIVAVAIKYQ